VTTRALTIGVFGLLLVAGVALDVLARRPGARVATFGDLVSGMLRTRLGRLTALAVWAWLGWHFLAR
jgi:Family of unknown function (DUF6186)